MKRQWEKGEKAGRFGIIGMLKHCKPVNMSTSKLNLPELFERMYAIKREREVHA